MTKTQATIAALSLAARRALMNAGTSRQGAQVQTFGDRGAAVELLRLGLVGTGMGLTQEGSIVREGIMDQEMEDFD